MTSTLRRQLAEIRMEHRWADVLEEIPRVREELGWPIMVTPLSQFVGVQAFLNVTTGRRWSQLPDEVVKYVLGHYGPPPRELDPEVERTVLSSPKVEELRQDEFRFDLEQARARWGERMTDEELLLRMTLPPEQVDAIRPGSRPARLRSPVIELIEGLTARSLGEVEVSAPGLKLRMRRTARPESPSAVT
jgi:oxaloacetate decarboxylase (Na+ extruding) subunit alpha